MSLVESSPPYEPSQPATASTSTPYVMRTLFGPIVYSWYSFSRQELEESGFSTAMRGNDKPLFGVVGVTAPINTIDANTFYFTKNVMILMAIIILSTSPISHSMSSPGDSPRSWVGGPCWGRFGVISNGLAIEPGHISQRHCPTISNGKSCHRQTPIHSLSLIKSSKTPVGRVSKPSHPPVPCRFFSRAFRSKEHESVVTSNYPEADKSLEEIIQSSRAMPRHSLNPWVLLSIPRKRMISTLCWQLCMTVPRVWLLCRIISRFQIRQNIPVKMCDDRQKMSRC